MKPMQLLDDLRSEHDVIERVALSLLRFIDVPEGTAAEARGYAGFFASFAGGWHHEREERLLVPALVSELHLPAGRGPVDVVIGDHRRMALLLAGMASASRDGAAFDRPRFRTAAASYIESLLAHIDMENSVFFPECETRLRRGGIRELDSRAISDEEREALAAAEGLVLHFPAVENLEQIRGEGCVMCSSYGVSCSGIEHEWWNEWEWEERDEHVAAS